MASRETRLAWRLVSIKGGNHTSELSSLLMLRVQFLIVFASMAVRFSVMAEQRPESLAFANHLKIPRQ